LKENNNLYRKKIPVLSVKETAYLQTHAIYMKCGRTVITTYQVPSIRADNTKILLKHLRGDVSDKN